MAIQLVARCGRALLPLLLVAPVVLADTELVLLDDQVLRGRAVEREGDLYLLSLEGGQVLPLPVALVREVREIEDPADAISEIPESDALESDDTVSAEAQIPLVDRDGTPERPRLLIQLPDGVAGASRFSSGVVAPDWIPENFTPERPLLDELDPSGFYRSPIDAKFPLDSGFESPEGEAPFRPASWGKPAVRSNWKPRDGFGEEDP